MRDKAKGDGTVKPKVYIAEPVPTFVENYLSEHCDYENGIKMRKYLVIFY